MIMVPPKSYIICTSPRSGSTLLCGLLKQTGLAGQPDSLFHQPALDRWLDYYDLANATFTSRKDALSAVFVRAQKKGTGDTEVFGMRIQRPSFSYFIEQLGVLYPARVNDVERIAAAFGPTRFMYLNRTDKLAQAVSRVMATQTGLWHRASDGSELERLAPPETPRYDFAAISGHLAEFQAMDVAWNLWFSSQGVDPLRIDYDALSFDPQGMLARVLDALALDTSAAHGTVAPTARLADDVNRDWMERFVRDAAGR